MYYSGVKLFNTLPSNITVLKNDKKQFRLVLRNYLQITYFTLWGCLRTGCWGEYLDGREMKWQEIGENCIMRSFITCNPHPSRRMRMSGNVAWIGKNASVYKVMLGNYKGKIPLWKFKLIESVPGGKANILGGHRIGNSEQSVYMYTCPIEIGFRDRDNFTVQYCTVHCTDEQHAMSSHELQSALMLTVDFSKMYYIR
jgi:hypothetical protein